MSENLKTFIVVNPNSANNSTGEKWNEIKKTIEDRLGEISFGITERPMHASEIARQAIKDGYELIVSLGGDGTHNEVINGFFDNGKIINPDTKFGMIPRGTGGDFRRSVGYPVELEKCLTYLSGKSYREIDIGVCQCHDFNGNPVSRYFLNITSFGLGGEVDKRVNSTSKALGGFLSFFIASAGALIAYKNKEIRLEVDGEDKGQHKILLVAVCNGQYFGGSMWVAPNAVINDGLFDIIIQGDYSKLEVLTQNTKIYQGKHLDYEKVSSMRGKKVVATPVNPGDEVLIDMDGETPGKLPITLEVLPSIIKLKI